MSPILCEGPMGKSVCSVCLSPKAALNCGCCSEPVCKQCAQFVDEETFSYMQNVPQELSHTVYCGPCFDKTVAGPLESYNQTLENAKNILVYFKSQNKETHYIKRVEDPYQITKCDDRDEAVLRMAFWAAQSGFNSVIDVVLTPQKIRDGSYQTQIWSATGIPANVDERKILKDRSLRSQPN